MNTITTEPEPIETEPGEKVDDSFKEYLKSFTWNDIDWDCPPFVTNQD